MLCNSYILQSIYIIFKETKSNYFTKNDIKYHNKVLF